MPLGRTGAFLEEEAAELSVERKEKFYRQPRLRGQPYECPEVQGWGGVLRRRGGWSPITYGLARHGKSLDLALQWVGSTAGFSGTGASRENLGTIC